MVKAIKECMKNWVMTHKKLYWYIVVGLAVLAFGIITAMGCAKLETANAAQDTVTVTWDGKENTVPLGNYPYYIIVKGGGSRGDAVYMSFDKLTIRKPYSGNSYYGLGTFDSSGNVIQKDELAFFGNQDKSDFMQSVSYSNAFTFGTSLVDASNVISNYDICYCDTGEVVFSANPYGPKKMYSLDAPYISFQNVVVDNKLHDYYYNPRIFDSFYETYIKPSTWTYFGKLNNIDSALDKGYLLEATFLVELPTLEYIMGQYEAHDIDINWETNVIKKSGDMFHEWASNKKAACVELEFEYAFPIEPDANGNFTYSMTFEEVEFLLRAFNSEFQSQMVNYNDYTRSLIMSYLHIECVTASVQTSRDNTLLYGKVCTNQFERGIYNVCLEIIPEIDINTVTPEEMDKIILDAMEEAHDQYIKDLESRLDEIESQMGGMTSVDGAFGNLEGSDLWTGFRSLVDGLGSLAPSIRSLSILTGSVFAFLPITITGIMSTTLFAICIIAIIKAIRG